MVARLLISRPEGVFGRAQVRWTGNHFYFPTATRCCLPTRSQTSCNPNRKTNECRINSETQFTHSDLSKPGRPTQFFNPLAPASAIKSQVAPECDENLDIVSYFFSASFWYVFFYTRLSIFKGPVTASIRSWEDFRATASMYFFIGKLFSIDLRVLEHFVHRFEWVKVITSSSNDRVFSEISILFIEFYRMSLIFVDFRWFSLTLH